MPAFLTTSVAATMNKDAETQVSAKRKRVMKQFH
jgi:hypothetical protein